MARSTKRKIKTTKVSTNEIREVFNSDSNSRPIPQKVRKASDFFVDGSVENSIYNNFIDSEYCSADEGETKKDKLTRKPYKWSHWRNYGGNEYEGAEAKIYWKDVLDSNDNNHIIDYGFGYTYDEDTATEEYKVFNQLNLDPVVILSPDISKLESNIDNQIKAKYNLVGEYQSTMFNDTRVIDSLLATRVGIDYSGYPGGIPEFDIKVTPYISTVDSTISYLKEYLNIDTGEVESVRIKLMAVLSGAFTLTALIKILIETYQIIEEGNIPVAIRHFFDYFFGSKTPVEVILRANIKIPDWFLKGLEKLINGPVYKNVVSFINAILPLLAGLYFYIAVIITADFIWDLFVDDVNMEEIPFRFKEIVNGLYTINDIKDSKYTFKFDYKRLNSAPYHVDEKIEAGGSTHTYNLDDYTKGTPFSADNLVEIFPNYSNREMFINMDFLATVSQLDLDTPPPAIDYRIELIPRSYCKLHEAKITTFTVRVLPEKYTYPNFAIEGLPENDELFINTNITFKDVKYCDGIVIAPSDATYSGISLPPYNVMDGLFKVPYAKPINIPSFAKSVSSINLPYIGRDFEASGYDLMLPAFGLNNYGPAGIYAAYFVFENSQNIIHNPYFRLEKSSGVDYTDLRQYWTTTNMEIRNGAIYKDNAGVVGEFYQNVSLQDSNIFSTKYYKLQLDLNISAGKLYLVTVDTAFRNKLVSTSWQTNSSGQVIYLYPSGVAEVTEPFDALEFSSSGSKLLLLETLNTINVNQLKFITSSDFVGYITKCKLQYIPNKSFKEPSRGLGFAYKKPFNWTKGFMVNKTLLLYFSKPSTYQTLAMTIGINSTAVSSVVVSWVQKSGATQTYTVTPTEGVIELSRLSDPSDNIKEVLLDFQLPFSNPPYDTQLTSFTCNSPYLYDIADPNNRGVLVNSNVDFSGTALNPASIYANNFAFNKLPSLSDLDISDCIDFEDNLANIVSISTSFNCDNTNVIGDLIEVLHIPTISLVNTNVYSLGIGAVNYIIGTEPSIVWKNSKTPIPVEELNELVRRLDETATQNGILDIAGDNPEITDEYALEAIDNLIAKGWNVLYNELTIPVITLVGDSPLTWTLGETFVDPGATAYDERDGNISDDIVTSNNIDINTEGTYQVTYNVTDSDGNSADEVVRTVIISQYNFEEVTIGTQTWMAVNLDIDDGGGGIYAYNNDESNVATYGRLYTWDAAMRVASNISGWHLPTDAEWTTLTTYLGGTSVAGGKLKETGTTHWNSPNAGATNETGFTALPGGNRNYAGSFNSIGGCGYWRSATEFNASNAWYCYMHYNYSNVNRNNSSKEVGFSVRLIRD